MYGVLRCIILNDPVAFVSIRKILCPHEKWSPGYWVKYLMIQLLIRDSWSWHNISLWLLPNALLSIALEADDMFWVNAEASFHRVELLVVDWTDVWVNKTIEMSETS